MFIFIEYFTIFERIFIYIQDFSNSYIVIIRYETSLFLFC
jgi:hypothetical protein